MSRDRLVFSALLAASTFVVTLIWLTPRMSSVPELFAATHLAFHRLCHQNPARTMISGGGPMPVCARCASIYSSIEAGLLIAVAVAASGRKTRRIATRLVLAGMLAAIIEYALEKITGQASNLTRFLTTLPLGFGVGLWAGSMLLDSANQGSGERDEAPNVPYLELQKGNTR